MSEEETKNKFVIKTLEGTIFGLAVRKNTLEYLMQSVGRQMLGVNLVNIFIDLNSAIRRVVTERKTRLIAEYPGTGFTAAVINLCAHYRSYFKSHGVASRFFIVYGLNHPDITVSKYCPEYNKKFWEGFSLTENGQFISQEIERQLKLLNYLCNSIPALYFFNANKYDVPAFFEYIREYFPEDMFYGPGIQNIIVSKDDLSFELVNERTMMLRPRKSPTHYENKNTLRYKNEDTSYIATYKDFWEKYCAFRHVTNRLVLANPIPIKLYSNVLAISGTLDRSMKAMVGNDFSVAYNAINGAIQTGLLQEDKYYKQSEVNIALNSIGMSYNEQESEDRWKAIDVRFQAQLIIKSDPLYKNLVLTDLKSTGKDLQNVNAQYFSNNPLHLGDL